MKNSFLLKARHILAVITTFFISGLFTVLPITLTISLFYIVWHFVNKLTTPLHDIIVPSFLDSIPHFEVVFVILIIIGIGALMDLVLARTIIHTIEKAIGKLPLINPVYSGIKQLTNAFSKQGKQSFKHVVLIEFPRKGIYSVGFLSSDFPVELSPDKNIKFYNIFIPATPNPLHGYYIVCPENEVIITSLTRQEAMSMIISGGIIQPEHFQQK